MMRVARITIGLVLLLLLTVNCMNNKTVQGTASAPKQAADTTVQASDTSVLAQAFEMLGSLGNDEGWEFHVSDGEHVLAFSHSWPDEIGVWEIGLFEGTEPPHFFDVDLELAVWFRAAPLEDILPIEPDALIPELAEPSRMMIRVAKSALADEGACSRKLEEEEMRVLQAVADGMLEVAYDLQPAFTIALHKMYRGNDTFDAHKSGGGFDQLGFANILLIPDGFIICWGATLGGEVAFFYDGESLSVTPRAERVNPLPLNEAQKLCASNVAKLAAVVSAAELADGKQIVKLENAADVLLTNSAQVQGTRLGMYLDELYEQLVVGQGLSPPRQWSGYDPGPAISKVEMTCNEVQVEFIDYEDWDWSCILDSGQRRMLLGARPSGLAAIYVLDKDGLLDSIRCQSTDEILIEVPASDIEEAVSIASKMGQAVLARAEANDNLNEECIEVLTKAAERKVSVLSSSLFLATLLEKVSAGGNEMMYWLAIPSAREGQLHFRATSRVATLDYIPAPLVFRRYGDIEFQVRMQDGMLLFLTSEQSARSNISAEVKDAVDTIRRMRDSGLLHVPDFAQTTVDEFVLAVSTAQEYDSVTVKPLGEIEELTVGRG